MNTILALAFVIVVAAVQIFVQSVQISNLQHHDRAVTACVSNTAYTRPLFAQCLADYKDYSHSK